MGREYLGKDSRESRICASIRGRSFPAALRGTFSQNGAVEPLRCSRATKREGLTPSQRSGAWCRAVRDYHGNRVGQPPPSPAAPSHPRQPLLPFPLSAFALALHSPLRRTTQGLRVPLHSPTMMRVEHEDAKLTRELLLSARLSSFCPSSPSARTPRRMSTLTLRR